MKALWKIVLLIFLLGSCDEAILENEIAHYNSKKVELNEIGIQLYIPTNYIEISLFQYFKNHTEFNASLSPEQREKLLEEQGAKLRIFVDSLNQNSKLICFYGQNFPQVPLNRNTGGLVSTIIKESIDNLQFFPDSWIEFSKPRLSILPKISFLRIPGKMKFSQDASLWYYFDAYVVSSKKNSLMVVSSSQEEIHLEKFMELTELRSE